MVTIECEDKPGGGPLKMDCSLEGYKENVGVWLQGANPLCRNSKCKAVKYQQGTDHYSRMLRESEQLALDMDAHFEHGFSERLQCQDLSSAAERARLTTFLASRFKRLFYKAASAVREADNRRGTKNGSNLTEAELRQLAGLNESKSIKRVLRAIEGGGEAAYATSMGWTPLSLPEEIALEGDPFMKFPADSNFRVSTTAAGRLLNVLFERTDKSGGAILAEECIKGLILVPITLAWVWPGGDLIGEAATNGIFKCAVQEDTKMGTVYKTNKFSFTGLRHQLSTAVDKQSHIRKCLISKDGAGRLHISFVCQRRSVPSCLFSLKHGYVCG